MIYFNELNGMSGLAEIRSLYLIGFTTVRRPGNLTSPIERTPLNHSYGYDSTSVSPICFATFRIAGPPLKSDPFMNCPG